MRMEDFSCRSCGHRFEELVRSGESGDGVECPECGAVGADKQLSGFSVAGRSSSGGSSSFGGGASPFAGGGCGSGGFS